MIPGLVMMLLIRKWPIEEHSMKMRKFQRCVDIKSLNGLKRTEGLGCGKVIEVKDAVCFMDG